MELRAAERIREVLSAMENANKKVFFIAEIGIMTKAIKKGPEISE